MSQIGIKRLQKEYSNLIKSKKKLVYAKPLEANILIWNYILIGNQPPYNNGYYHGLLIYPNEYPIHPPSIKMITPNGCFETNTPINLFNIDTWKPELCIEDILYGLYRLMIQDVINIGDDINNILEQRKQYAIESYHFNKTNPIFMDLLEEMNGNKSTQYNIINKYQIFQ